MNFKALRVPFAIVLLLALGALASTASAKPGSSPGETRPGSGHHYTGHQVGQQAAILSAGRPGSGHHYTGHQLGQPSAIQPTGASIQPSETFDWADASVGAGFAVALGLLVASAVWLSSRRRGSIRGSEAA